MASSTEIEVDVKAEYDIVLKLQEEIDSNLARPDNLTKQALDVSSWTVAMQIEHILLANQMVTGGLLALVHGNLPNPKPAETNRLGRILLSRGVIPRGKADAPPLYTPAPELEIESLSNLSAKCRSNLVELAPHLDTIQNEALGFQHPYFGVLSAPVWMRFVHVHSLHHLKIVRDIHSVVNS